MRHKLAKPVPLQAIIELLGPEARGTSGPLDRDILGIASLPDPHAGTLAFCRHSDERLTAAISTRATALIVPAERRINAGGGPTLIFSDNPRRSFFRVAAWLYREPAVAGIHPTAVIDPSARIDPSAEIGACTFVGPRCQVGENTILASHVTLQRDVRIGAGSKIDAGTVLGAEGFGFERGDDGTAADMPHLAGVVIGDDVRIGANCCVDRGTLDDTLVADGVRIDNLVQVGHNVRIGRHSTVICQTTLSGSVQIGERVWISPGCQILNGAKIGDRVTIGMGSVVTKDVPAGEFWVGNPARRAPQR